MIPKTPIWLFAVNVMLNISVESTELPRPQSHAITFRGTKEVIVSLPSRALRSFPSSSLWRSRCFVSRFLLSLQCSSLSLGKPVEEAVNGQPPSTHSSRTGYKHYRQLRQKSNRQIIVATGHHGLLTRLTRKVENTERGSTSYN